MGSFSLCLLLIGLLASVGSPKLKTWGYGPPSFMGLLLVLVVALVMTGHLPWAGWIMVPRS